MNDFSIKFTNCIKFLIGIEGGFSNDPHDRGGATNMGITQETLSRWRKAPVSTDDVKKLTLDEAMQIYSEWYWKPMGLDLIESSVLCKMLFDQGVNRGIGTVAKQIQVLVNAVPDGKIGPITAAAINRREARGLAIEFFKASQMQYSFIEKNHPDQAANAPGWMARTHRLLDLILVGNEGLT